MTEKFCSSVEVLNRRSIKAVAKKNCTIKQKYNTNFQTCYILIIHDNMAIVDFVPRILVLHAKQIIWNQLYKSY